MRISDWSSDVCSSDLGFSLTEAIIPRQFLSLEDIVEFVSKGSEDGMLYGQRGQGSGRMPGFVDNSNTEDEEDGMFTEDKVKAVACYAATLSADRVAGCRTAIQASDDEATTTTTTAASDATTTNTTANPEEK